MSAIKCILLWVATANTQFSLVRISGLMKPSDIQIQSFLITLVLYSIRLPFAIFSLSGFSTFIVSSHPLLNYNVHKLHSLETEGQYSTGRQRWIHTAQHSTTQHNTARHRSNVWSPATCQYQVTRSYLIACLQFRMTRLHTIDAGMLLRGEQQLRK